LSKLDPAQTIITLAGDIPWRVPDLAPPDSVAEAVMAGSEDGEGAYLVLIDLGSRAVSAAAPQGRVWPIHLPARSGPWTLPRPGLPFRRQSAELS
jgi:hypothetical protein